MTEVRPATKDDLYEILVLSKKFSKESGYSFSFDMKALEENLNSLMGQDSFFLHIAEDEGEVIGFLAASLNRTLFSSDVIASELGWYVDPQHRGNKASIQLLKNYEEWAKESGAKYTAMMDIDSLNDLSDLFERRGYSLQEKTYVKEN